MENKTQLTAEELEYLALYLHLFKKAYYIQTRKDLTTVDQIIDLIKSGKFTFDDVFNTHLDKSLDDLDTEDGYYWEDNMQMFDCENYFPNADKRIEEGAWIKIRNENGFEVHYAKVARRKRRFNEESDVIQKKLIRLLSKTSRELEDSKDKSVEEIVSPKMKSKQKFLEDKLKELSVREAIGLKPYEVKIMRTKSVAEYYLPYQYEIVKDIEEFSDAYINSLPGVSTKSLYSSANSDAVFYLQSRGISKKVAQMMATLKQTYFKVDMKVALTEYGKIFNQQVREALAV